MVLSFGIKLCSVERERLLRLRGGGAHLTHFPYYNRLCDVIITLYDEI